MSDTCATVKIKDANAPGGFVVINEEDFDEKIHTKLSPAAEAKVEAAAEKAVEASIAKAEKADAKK
jgi:hypothetical protein